MEYFLVLIVQISMEQIIEKGESKKVIAEILQRYGLIVKSVQETGESVLIKVSEPENDSLKPRPIN